jgi:acyl-coenzyme A synthetase/AMP-(fatty) acid ligase
MNLTDPIWRHAETCPDRTALLYDGQAMSFAALCRDAEGIAVRLAAAGIEKGQRVAVRIGNPVVHLAVVLALARIGAASTSVETNLPPEAQSQLARQCGVTAYVRHNAGWKIAGIAEQAHILTDQLLGGDKARLAAGQVAGDAGGLPWRIGLTSGTTGVPKGVAWTHAQASRFLELLQTAWPSGPAERLLVFIDPSLLFALNQMLRQLAAGGAVVVPKGSDGAEFFRCLKRDGVTQVMTSPALAAEILQYAKTRDAAEGGAEETEVSKRLRIFAIGGSAVPPALLSELRNRICPNLYISYGSTEAGMMARADPVLLRQSPGAAGYLVPWAEAETVDDEGKVLPRGGHGNLRFRLTAGATGYEGDPEASAKVFRDGWYYPGDTGSIDSRGVLTLGARGDDLINLGGMKIDPMVVEAVLNEDPAVRESVVVAVANDVGAAALVALVVVRQPIDEAALRAKCRERLGAALAPAKILTVERLPRDPQGKLLRREVAKMIRVQIVPATGVGDALN